MGTKTVRVALFTSGLFLMAVISGCKGKKDTPTAPPPVRVSVMAVSESAPGSGVSYSGTVTASETSMVSFSVAGTITNLYVAENQKVSKGQVLGKVRDGDYVNTLNIAEAQLAEAQDGYDRLKKLHDANALPDVKWVEMEQKLKQAQNAVEIAKRSVGDALLRSPVSGTVTRKLADVGQTVLPAQPVYEIISTGDLTIDISVSENLIGNFYIGEKATVKFDNPELPELMGKVTQKSVVADPLTRGYTVKVAVPAEHGKVLPGMLADVTFERKADISQEQQVIVLPLQSVLLNEDNRLFVWTVKNNVAERKFVEADELSSHGVIVKSGLTPGDSVIVSGMQKVGTGTRVVPVVK